MAMNDGDDLTVIFSRSVVLRMQNEMLAWRGSNVAAWPVTLAAFDDMHNAACLARVLLLGMRDDGFSYVVR